ncbi:hypothetical protein D049_1961 [Vibrio parahaemolyticus VPTS-2010]|nr:hypothetical protein D049_1961 [Vibrio parahaemolyticus VPTS-2010]
MYQNDRQPKGQPSLQGSNGNLKYDRLQMPWLKRLNQRPERHPADQYQHLENLQLTLRCRSHPILARTYQKPQPNTCSCYFLISN